MKKLYYLSRFLLFLVGMTLTLHACLEENMDDCEPQQPNVKIVVRTLAEASRATDTNTTSDIDNVVLYVFDENENFVTMWQGGTYTYGEEYAAYIDMYPGTYHFVVWTNQFTTYAPSETRNTAAELVVSLQYPSDKKVTTQIPELHHGMLLNAEVTVNTDNEFLILIAPNTYKLNFTVEGLQPDDNQYSFTVTDNNTHYAFDNTILEGMEEIAYIRTTAFTGDELATSMNVLRLTDSRSPTFDFSNLTRDESIFTDGLVNIIKKAYNSAGLTVDFDSEHEFDITLTFNAWMEVTISVNGWSYTPNETQLTGS